MKLPRCVTCHPAPVKIPPDTSPTDVRFVSGSKIVALPAGEGDGVGVGSGVFPPVSVGGGVGVGVPPVIPGLPVAFDTLDDPVNGVGVDGSWRLQLQTNAIATKIAAGRQNGVHVTTIGVVKVGVLPFSSVARRTRWNGLRRTRGSVRIHALTVYVMRKNNDSIFPDKRNGKTERFAGTRTPALASYL